MERRRRARVRDWLGRLPSASGDVVPLSLLATSRNFWQGCSAPSPHRFMSTSLPPLTIQAQAPDNKEAAGNAPNIVLTTTRRIHMHVPAVFDLEGSLDVHQERANGLRGQRHTPPHRPALYATLRCRRRAGHSLLFVTSGCKIEVCFSLGDIHSTLLEP